MVAAVKFVTNSQLSSDRRAIDVLPKPVAMGEGVNGEIVPLNGLIL